MKQVRQLQGLPLSVISHPSLPKAKLITFKLSFGKPYFAKFRCANFIRRQIGWLTIETRAPWLTHVALQQHGHLFGDD